MYYHLSDHIYITQFRDELILLDTKRDKYTVCFKQLSKLFDSLLERDEKKNTSYSDTPAHAVETLDTDESRCIQKLLEDNIIENKDFPYPFQIDRKIQSNGVTNVDWRLPLINKKVHSNIQVLKALYTLIKVNFYMKFRGLYQTIQLIKKTHQTRASYIIPNDEGLIDLANIVNKACLLYPTRTKCLEWAVTYVLLALRQGWKCNLEIGIQNYPFMAHAWVECNEKAVMDSPELRKGLAIILNEPFRKVKT